MQVIHTSYIKRLADKTGKTYRDLESLWKKFEREVENDRMFNPNKFSHMRTIDGTMAQEIARRFEQFLADPLGVESEQQEKAVDTVEDELLANEIETKMEDDISSELEELTDDDEITVETNDVDVDETEVEAEAEPEIDFDDFEDITEL